MGTKESSQVGNPLVQMIVLLHPTQSRNCWQPTRALDGCSSLRA